MPETEAKELICLGYSHRTAPIEIRERLNLEEKQLVEAGLRFKSHGSMEEFMILSTCNRWELYAVSNNPIKDEVNSILADLFKIGRKELEEYYHTRSADKAVTHFIEVCTGLDSQILGETEVLGQVKAAYSQANDSQTIGPVLHRICQKGFQAAKWLRTHTAIGHGQVSLGNVAVGLAERIFNKLKQRRILVVGTGQVGLDTAKAFLNRGARHLYLTSRNTEKSTKLAEGIGAEAIEFSNWISQARLCDVVVCTTSAPGNILELKAVETMMRLRPARPLFIIDLAVPRDVDPAVNELENVFLYTLDDLATISNENLKARQAELEECRLLAAERAERLWREIEPRLQSTASKAAKKSYDWDNTSSSQRPAEASGGVDN